MSNPSTQNENPFLEKMETLNDEELLRIIQNGSDYQPHAVEAAVRKATDRNLITKMEGENILQYTQNQTENKNHLNEKKATQIKNEALIQIIAGTGLLTAGLWLTNMSEGHYYYIGAIVFGLVLLVRGAVNRI